MGHNSNGTVRLWDNLRLNWGKVRRFYYRHFRKQYIERMARLRQGECRRCGACCMLGIRCPHLDEATEPVECRIHSSRYGNCEAFPIDPKDLADRDVVRPDIPCGFSFRSNDALES